MRAGPPVAGDGLERAEQIFERFVHDGVGPTLVRSSDNDAVMDWKAEDPFCAARLEHN